MDELAAPPLVDALIWAAELLLGASCIALAAVLLRMLRRNDEPRQPGALRAAAVLLALVGALHLLMPAAALLGAVGIGTVRLLTFIAAAGAVPAAFVAWRAAQQVPPRPAPEQRPSGTAGPRTLEMEAINRELTVHVDSLGTLAGGVAHDFNNLLTVISGHLDLLRRALRGRGDPALQESLFAIEEAAHRAETLSRQMLAYSGRGHFMLTPTDVNECVHPEDLADTDGIDIVVEKTPGLPEIDAAPVQLRQLVDELMRNAVEAAREGDLNVGEVHVRTREEVLDADELVRSVCPHEMSPGPAVVIEIADTGPGMGDDVLPHLFEPYFSTRFTGRGLGMAAVHGIARGHGAALFVDTTPGSGTSIRVAFAHSTDDEAGFRTLRNQVRPRRVLILDDEPSLLKLAAEYCRRLDIEAITTEDPDEAVEILLTQGADIHAVVLDYLMPLRTGDEVLREIRQFSAVDIYLTSGFSRGELHDPELHAELAGFIAKPFSMSDFEDIFGQEGKEGA